MAGEVGSHHLLGDKLLDNGGTLGRKEKGPQRKSRGVFPHFLVDLTRYSKTQEKRTV